MSLHPLRIQARFLCGAGLAWSHSSFLVRNKKKTYHNSIFVISNNIIVGDSKATVAFLLFKILERKNFNKSKFFRNNTNVIKMTIRNIHLLWREKYEDCTEHWVNSVLCLYIHCGSKLDFSVERGWHGLIPLVVAYSESIPRVIQHSNNVSAVMVNAEPTVLVFYIY